MGQGTVDVLPKNFPECKAVEKHREIYSIYLGSTITNTLSLNDEINMRIDRTASTFGKLMKREWEKLTTTNKILIYQACIVISLLYGSE